MRNFKKALALATSVAAICTSASVFADTYEVTGLNGSYDAENNALTLTVDGAAGDKTVLVLANGVADTAATGDDILYINQYTADETAFSAMGLKGTDALAVGEYAVKIGYEDANGDFAIANGKIVVTAGATGKTITVKWGDITGDGNVDGSDSLSILMKYIGVAETYNIQDNQVVVGGDFGGYKWGDVTGDGNVDGSDSLSILMKYIGVAETYTVNGQSVTVGSDLDIVVE